MGCIASKPAYRNCKKPATFLLELNPRSFRVANVDDDGVEQNYGVLEVRDNDLLFHQSETLSILSVEQNNLNQSGGFTNNSSNSEQPAPIRWPLKSLRRYGFDGDLFSFESGRRCATGPGIYAFRCARSELLFQLVQDSIVRLGREEEQQEIRRIMAEQSFSNVGRFGSTNNSNLMNHTNLGLGNNNSDLLIDGMNENRTNDKTNHNLLAMLGNGQPFEDRQYVNKDIKITGPNYVNTALRDMPNYLNQSASSNGNISNNNIIPNERISNTKTSPNHNEVIQYAQLDLPAMLNITKNTNEDDIDEEEDDKIENDDDKTNPNSYVNMPKIGIFSRTKFLNNCAALNNNNIHEPSQNNTSTLGNVSTTAAATASNNIYLNVTPPNEKITYIQLDLDYNVNEVKKSSTSTMPPLFTATMANKSLTSPIINNNNNKNVSNCGNGTFSTTSSTTDCYATIDLERTQAISNKTILQNSKIHELSKFKRFNSNMI